MEMQMALPQFRELPSETRVEQRAHLLAAVQAPRRRRAFVLAAAAAILVATPALALHRQVVDFFSSESAPERIQLDFQWLRRHNEEMRGRGMGGPAVSPEGAAREVLTVDLDGEKRSLWVVPTTEGGFCYRLHFYGSCTANKADAPLKIGVGGLSNAHGDGLAWVVGSVLAPQIETVQLLYQDGERVTLPYVWVSEPIDAGFYAYEVPEEHRVLGRLTAAVIGLDENGHEVQRLRVP